MSTVQSQQLWGGAYAYERYMGRWSRRIASSFTTWIAAPPRASWLDIGCGTGVLTSAVLQNCDPSRVVAIDSSETFLQVARSHLGDGRVTFKQGNAQAIPEDDAVFDFAISGLLLNFVPDKALAIREMMRVLRPGGIIALYVWDYAGHMQIMRHFFDAATALDHMAIAYDDGVKAPICRPGPLIQLLTGAGLRDVEVRAIDIATEFKDFDDFWTPFLGGTGSGPKYCMSLSEDARNMLKEAVRKRLPTGPDGEILLAARAWAAKACAQ